MDISSYFSEIFVIEDMTATLTGMEIFFNLLLSFALASVIGKVYQRTHRGISYTQGYVQTLIVMGVVVSLIMLVVGSSIARAFSLVGALSIIRFRNAVKETRDVGFIFLVMAIGMAVGTQFYLLAVISTVVICGIIILMNRFNWYKNPASTQILKIKINGREDFDHLFDEVFEKYLEDSHLVSADSSGDGSKNDLVYRIEMKRGADRKKFLSAMHKINSKMHVTLITGHKTTDI